MIVIIILIAMILFGMLWGINGGGLGDNDKGYRIVGELIQIGEIQVLIGTSDVPDLIRSKITPFVIARKIKEDINGILQQLEDLPFKQGIDVYDYRDNLDLINFFSKLRFPRFPIIMYDNPVIKELLDYIPVITYTDDMLYKPTIDTIKIGNIIISFNRELTFYFDNHFMDEITDMDENYDQKVILMIDKYKSDNQLRYWNVNKDVIMDDFEEEIVKIPYIVMTGRYIFGVDYFAISENMIIFGESHHTVEEIKKNMTSVDEGLMHQMSNYIKELNEEMKRRDSHVTFYSELAPIGQMNNVNAGISHNIKTIFDTFRDGTFSHIKVRFLDIREHENVFYNLFNKLFDKEDRKKILQDIVLSTDLKQALRWLDIEEGDWNTITMIFSVEHPYDKDTAYKQYLKDHPFLSRAAYEVMRLKQSDKHEYASFKQCLMQTDILTDGLDYNDQGDLKFLSRYTDCYLIARVLRKQDQYVVIYGGISHAITYVHAFTRYYSLHFKEYKSHEINNSVVIHDMGELLFRGTPECKIL